MRYKTLILTILVCLFLHSADTPGVFSPGRVFSLEAEQPVPAQGVEEPSDILTASQDSGAPLRTISLDEASRLALSNSLDIQIAKFDAYRKRTSLAKAESIFDTFLNSEVSYRDNRKKASSSLAGTREITNKYALSLEKKLPLGSGVEIETKDTRISSNSTYVTTNPYHEGSVEFRLTQPLGRNFFGLADRSGIKIAKIDIENTEYTSLGDIENTIHSVQLAYWNLALKEEELKVKSDILKEAEKLYTSYQEKYSLGLAEEGDLFAVRANLKARESDVLVASLERDIAKNNLLFLLNEEDTSIRLKPQDELDIVPYGVDLCFEMAEAILNRRDYKIIQGQLKSLGIDIQVKKNALWPEIDLEASYLKNGIASKLHKSWQNIAEEDNPDIFVGLTFRAPLENRSAKADLKEAKLHKEQLLLSFKRIERLILKDLNNTVKEVNMLKSQVELLGSIVGLQENKLKEEMKRFGYGRSSTDTIIRYEEDLLGAKMDLIRSLFNYRISLLDLALTKNTLLNQYWEGKI